MNIALTCILLYLSSVQPDIFAMSQHDIWSSTSSLQAINWSHFHMCSRAWNSERHDYPINCQKQQKVQNAAASDIKAQIY